MKEEEVVVVDVEGRRSVDCSLLAGNIHQPDKTERHVSISRPSRTVTGDVRRDAAAPRA